MYRYALARHRAIVTRLSAAQDLAAMDVLLCDKTAGRLHQYTPVQSAYKVTLKSL